jgi:hypothetical protein
MSNETKKDLHKKVIYTSSSSGYVIVMLFIIGFCLLKCAYDDFNIDGLLFNDIYLYLNMLSIIIIPTCVTVFLIFFTTSKILIIDDKLVIYCYKSYCWMKPYIFDLKDIQKIAFSITGKTHFFDIYYGDFYCIRKKRIPQMLSRKSQKKLYAILHEYGIEVYEICGKLVKIHPQKTK